MLTEIPKADELAGKVFSVSNEKLFQQIALQVFALQFRQNSIYQAYCKAIRKTPDEVKSFGEIPFLPIQFFKSHEVKTGSFEADLVFKSSGTTGQVNSKHYVKDRQLYESSFLQCFEQFFGKPEQYVVLGLLPSYIEQGSSSLVYMIDRLIQQTGRKESGFYLYEHQMLFNTLMQLEKERQPTLLFGVTYALLDFAKSFSFPLEHTTVVETGGMKGRKKEMSKPELLDELKHAFFTDKIFSEYGMTELLSQAYAKNGRYRCPPWMQVVLRDETDPFSVGHTTGAINIIDLANIHSCSFIATEDLGRQFADNSFEVIGRMDNTDIRGCSQMVL